MKKRLAKDLLEALSAPRTVKVVTKGDPTPLYGYVVGISDAFVLLHCLERDTVTLNGYVALPLREIVDLPANGNADFFYRALQLKGLKPRRQPDILLFDFPGLLSSADAHFPLVTLETEHLYPGVCRIGRVARLTEKSVLLREIDAEAAWTKTHKYRFRDITLVAFGGGYEDALWRVAEDEKETQKTTES